MQNETIEIDIDDLNQILSYEGKIMDVTDIFTQDKFNTIISTDVKETLQKAKGVVLKFEINKDFLLQDLSDLVEKVTDILSEDADIIFSTTTNNDLENGIFKCSIVITGIQ